MTAMIDDACARTRGNGSWPAGPGGDGGGGQVRHIRTGPRPARANQAAFELTRVPAAEWAAADQIT
jgi:hypothetical protein